MLRIIAAFVAIVALGACSNPTSPLEQLLECDTIDRNHAANFDSAALTRCDTFDRSDPVA